MSEALLIEHQFMEIPLQQPKTSSNKVATESAIQQIHAQLNAIQDTINEWQGKTMTMWRQFINTMTNLVYFVSLCIATSGALYLLFRFVVSQKNPVRFRNYGTYHFDEHIPQNGMLFVCLWP